LASTISFSPKLADISQDVTLYGEQTGEVGTYLFAILGGLRWSAPSALLWLLLGVAAYFFAVSGGAVGEARFRLPVMPMICFWRLQALSAAKRIRRAVTQSE
jgi:hypothetical protein